MNDIARSFVQSTSTLQTDARHSTDFSVPGAISLLLELALDPQLRVARSGIARLLCKRLLQLGDRTLIQCEAPQHHAHEHQRSEP
ncbi:MAG TPA: hypothetical protein VFN67_31340 [Polyangiales bacterium]|nr:hypothetical protein [Polyangiales bacterium]